MCLLSSPSPLQLSEAPPPSLHCSLPLSGVGCHSSPPACPCPSRGSRHSSSRLSSDPLSRCVGVRLPTPFVGLPDDPPELLFGCEGAELEAPSCVPTGPCAGSPLSHASASPTKQTAVAGRVWPPPARFSTSGQCQGLPPLPLFPIIPPPLLLLLPIAFLPAVAAPGSPWTAAAPLPLPGLAPLETAELLLLLLALSTSNTSTVPSPRAAAAT
mmetsp:Transcript_14928/g.40261  ORF Transcript_14928/g.40261 Transcript_14928/m.40261 type:complete len:213 (+) Transcript_14928:215-853(+)